MNERERRLAAAAEAVRLGRGGVTTVSRATGLSRPSIYRGIRDLNAPPLEAGQVRRPGVGRRRLGAVAPDITAKLESLIEPVSGGDLEAPLRWTSKSMRVLADELTATGYPVSHEKVIQLLRRLGYNLQGGRPAAEGSKHLDRAAQFRHVNQRVKDALAQNLPVIAVNTMKKAGADQDRQWRSLKLLKWDNAADIQKLLQDCFKMQDTSDPWLLKVCPGIYDIGQDGKGLDIETDYDATEFTLASVRGWWQKEGKQLYPTADRLLIVTDHGGSTIHQCRRWMVEIWKLAEQNDVNVAVCHLPPGTSKWHNVAHRLFSFVSSSWQGQPPCDSETVVSLIAAAPQARGLDVNCRLDHSKHPFETRRSKASDWSSCVYRDKILGDWNYDAKRTFKCSAQRGTGK